MEIRVVLMEALNNVRRAKGLSPPRSDVEVSALRWELYASLQNILDAVAIIVSDLGLRRPSSYGDLGRVLREAGFVDERVYAYIRTIAAARNTLAHAYRRLSAEDLDKVVKEVVPMVEEVVRVVGKLVDERSIDPAPSALSGLEDVFKRFRIKLAYLFGSRARGLERSDSDYDVAVLVDGPEASVMDEVRLALELADRLGVPVDKVDVVLLNKADPILKARVLKDAKLIYAESEGERRRWERETYLQILRLTDLYAAYVRRLKKNSLKTGEADQL